MADDGLTNKAIEGKLEELYVRTRGADRRNRNVGVPELPRLSFQRLHHPILLLANSPYLERKEGSGGDGRTGGDEADLNHDGCGESAQKSEWGK